jgi:hypothetical protein
MAKKKQVDLRIDELTTSLKNTITGESFTTDFCRATKRDVAKKKHWLFNWQNEIARGERKDSKVKKNCRLR